MVVVVVVVVVAVVVVVVVVVAHGPIGDPMVASQFFKTGMGGVGMVMFMVQKVWGGVGWS